MVRQRGQPECTHMISGEKEIGGVSEMKSFDNGHQFASGHTTRIACVFAGSCDDNHDFSKVFEFMIVFPTKIYSLCDFLGSIQCLYIVLRWMFDT